MKASTSSTPKTKTAAKKLVVAKPALAAVSTTAALVASKGSLYEAHNQWRDRPADQRFWTIDEMRAKCFEADQSRKVFESVKLRDIRIDQDMRITIGETKAPVTNWAFKQICDRTKIPAYFLSTLPAEKAAELLDWSFQNRVDEKTQNRVSIASGSVEAFTSDRYAYIPNYRICDGLRVLEGLGWKTPPARPAFENQPGARKATQADVLKKSGRNGISVKVGDLIAPAGLYASSKDMFAFLVNEGSEVDDGANNGLKRGVFVSNSEVGAAAFKITCFLYDSVCGNHIVWGADVALQASIRHLGEHAGERAFQALEKDLSAWSGGDPTSLTKTIRAARRTILGDSQEEIVKKLVAQKSLYISKAEAIDAYNLVEKLDADRVDPRSVWGMVTGYTRLSQLEPHGDKRLNLEQAAGRIMMLVEAN